MGAMAMLPLLLGPRAGAEQMPIAVVLASTAPGYATGQVLADAPLTIPDGASTVFLLPSGRVVTVKGPYAGPLTSPQPAVGRSSLAQLFAPGQDSSEIGGSRSLEEPKPADRLLLDPSAGGVFCLAPETEVMLARPADPNFTTLELRHLASGRVAELAWKGTAHALAWPRSLPLGAGPVRVTSANTGAERRLEFRALGAAHPSPTAHAAELALAGCTRQAAAALAALHDALTPLGIYLSSDRGRYPVYRSGEEMGLVVQTNRDAYVYCLIRDAKGQLAPLFPWQASQARVPGQRTLNLPGAWLPRALRAGAELNGSEIRCLASERDLATALPQLAGAAGAGPLPEEAAATLDRLAADPRQGPVATSQLILRVED
jgi:hypothetical protein